MIASITADWLQLIERSRVAVLIRKSSWLYPGLEIIHIIGIAVLVGAAVLFDLRLLGSSRHLPLIPLGKHLLSWSKRGLILVIPSGILLFCTNAEELANDPVFWIKMALLVVAGLNALLFNTLTAPGLGQAKEGSKLPLRAHLAAIISIIVWIAAISCGRLLAY